MQRLLVIIFLLDLPWMATKASERKKTKNTEYTHDTEILASNSSKLVSRSEAQKLMNNMN